MLLLPGQTGEDWWDLLKSSVLSEVGGHWTDKHIHLVAGGLIFVLLYR